MIRVFRHYISSAFLGLFLAEFGVFFASMYYGHKVLFLFSEPWYSAAFIFYASLLFAITLSLCTLGIGLYRRSLVWSEYDLLSRVGVSFLAAILIMVFTIYLFPVFLVGRSVLILAIIFAFLGLMACRYAFYKLVKKDGFFTKKILLIGGGIKAKNLIENNHDYIHGGIKVLGCVVVEGEDTVVDTLLFVLGDNSLLEVARDLEIDEIVIAVEDRRMNLPIEALLECKMSGITIVDLLSFYERENAIIHLETLYPSWLIFSDGFIQNNLRLIKKRFVDLVMSLVLLVVTWPVMLVTALAILWESKDWKAPILYRQERVGQDGKVMTVLKFRSMGLDAEKDGVQWAQEVDSRVTAVGAVIRKYRIDELPQIFNVFCGDMSFVGPRPERPVFVDEFKENIDYYDDRHRVKPGITGWAQLCYPYGSSEHDAIQKLQYDLYYVKNHSLFLDMVIILHTVEVVLWGRGAR